MCYSKTKIATILFLLPTIIACGGGGSGGSAPVNTTPVIDNASIQQVQDTLAEKDIPETVETELDMSELVASDNFQFSNKQQVKVLLDLGELLAINDKTDQRAYVSIYRDYQLLPSGEFYPQSDSRVLGGEINNGQFNHAFVALTNQSEYLIEVWFYDGEPAIQKKQTLAANTLNW